MAMLKMTSGGPAPDKKEINKHQQLIGHIGLWVPLILIGLVLWRDGLDVWNRLDSVSAYYYTGGSAVFTGMLVALALFLFTYDGYRDDAAHRADRWLAGVAGFAALVVAIFPTSAPPDIPPLAWVKPWVVKVHFGSAVLLFASFAVYCFWLFPRTGGKPRDLDKVVRTGIYWLCGGIIVLCIGWAFHNRLSDRSIFWQEACALIAFSASWLIKGRADKDVQQLLGLDFGWLRKFTGSTRGSGPTGTSRA